MKGARHVKPNFGASVHGMDSADAELKEIVEHLIVLARSPEYSGRKKIRKRIGDLIGALERDGDADWKTLRHLLDRDPE